VVKYRGGHAINQIAGSMNGIVPKTEWNMSMKEKGPSGFLQGVYFYIQ